MKKLYFLLTFLFSSVCNAQIFDNIALNIGYGYLGRSSVSLGAEYNIPIDKKNWNGYSTGISARYFKGENNKQYIIPEFRASYRYMGFMINSNISTEHINPNVGLNLMNAICLYTGYSFTFNKSTTNLNGIVFGINILIGKDGFYDDFTIGF